MFAILLTALLAAAVEPEQIQAPREVKPIEVNEPLQSGYYLVESTDYVGIVTIIVVHDKNVIGMKWALDDGSTADGMGTIEDGKLWVAYKTPNVVGLARYNISMKDGRTFLLSDRFVKERMVFIKKLKE